MDVSQRLHRLSLDCNYNDCDNCDHSYNKMLNFYLNEMNFQTMTQFHYCPFHMENQNKKKMMNIDQMITCHASCGNYKINYLGVKCMYYLTLSIIQDMIKLGAIAVTKRYFMQAFTRN